MRLSLSFLFLLIISTNVQAGQWSVTPVRMDINAESRSPIVTVNNSAKTNLKVQARLMSWSQDEKGNDITEESKDLVFFPRQMTVLAGDERAIKVGSLKETSGALEKTYRIFIQDLPEARKNQDKAQVSFSTRMSIPIYISPANPVYNGKLGKIVSDQKHIIVPIINTGNTHLTIRHISVVGKSKDGEELCRFSTDEHWYHYVLTNVTYTHQIDIPECSSTQPATFKIEVTTDPELQTMITGTIANLGK